MTQAPLFGVEQSRSTGDDYYTPAWIFERMGITFDLDVAAPPGGIPWVPAARYFTKADDGLVQPWAGRVWMNPPYSQTTPWVDRFMEHRHGVCLVPWAKSKWTLRLWADADAITLPADGFFDFMAGGRLTKMFISVFFAAYGDECVEAIARLGTVRVAA